MTLNELSMCSGNVNITLFANTLAKTLYGGKEAKQRNVAALEEVEI